MLWKNKIPNSFSSVEPLGTCTCTHMYYTSLPHAESSLATSSRQQGQGGGGVARTRSDGHHRHTIQGNSHVRTYVHIHLQGIIFLDLAVQVCYMTASQKLRGVATVSVV